MKRGTELLMSIQVVIVGASLNKLQRRLRETYQLHSQAIAIVFSRQFL